MGEYIISFCLTILSFCLMILFLAAWEGLDGPARKALGATTGFVGAFSVVMTVAMKFNGWL